MKTLGTAEMRLGSVFTQGGRGGIHDHWNCTLRPYPHITRLISNCLIYPMDPKEAGEGFRRDYGVIYLDLPIGICTLYPQKLIYPQIEISIFKLSEYLLLNLKGEGLVLRWPLR